jgi:hypothetical protein
MMGTASYAAKLPFARLPGTSSYGRSRSCDPKKKPPLRAAPVTAEWDSAVGFGPVPGQSNTRLPDPLSVGQI